MPQLRRRLAPLALVGLTACFVDVGAGASNPDAGATTPGTDSSADTSADDAGETSGTTSTGQGPTTASASEAGTTAPTTGGPDPTSVTDGTTTSTTMTTMTTDPVTTDEPGPICGNGFLERGEDCDDGNFDNLDDCLADCTPASCFDGYTNQGEVDGDCGGPCPPCGPCRACNSDAGCAAGLTCMGGVCNEYHTVEFDYFTECGLNTNVFASVALGDYPGPWRVEALAGAGLIDELNGWGWLADCTGFDLASLGAPFIHPTAGEAFDAIDPKAIVVDYAGGETRCGILDNSCDDNFGGAQLGFSLECD